MEVREIVETVIKDPLLEVRFRMSTDTDEVIRIAELRNKKRIVIAMTKSIELNINIVGEIMLKITSPTL